MAFLAKGSKLNPGDEGSPEAFTPITGVVEINVPSPTTASLPTTDHDTTDKNTTSEPGLITAGDVSVMYKVDPTDANQAQLETDQAAGTTRNYTVTIPTSPLETKSFAAWVKNVEPATPVDGHYTKRATLEVTGAVT